MAACVGRILNSAVPFRLGRDSLRMLSQDRILDNQEAIVLGLSALRTKSVADVILLDAHLLIDSQNELIEIPVDVIRRFALDAVVFVYDAPEKIVERRHSDHYRDRAKRSREDIAQEQFRAGSLAERYARDLGVLFTTATPSQKKYLGSLLREWLRL